MIPNSTHDLSRVRTFPLVIPNGFVHECFRHGHFLFRFVVGDHFIGSSLQRSVYARDICRCESDNLSHSATRGDLYVEEARNCKATAASPYQMALGLDAHDAFCVLVRPDMLCCQCGSDAGSTPTWRLLLSSSSLVFIVEQFHYCFRTLYSTATDDEFSNAEGFCA